MKARLRYALIMFAGVLVLGAADSVLAGTGNSKPNREIMEGLCRDALDAFFDAAKIPDTTEIVLHIEDGEANHFFTPIFFESFHQRYRALYSHDRTSGAGVSVSLGALTVDYGSPFSESFLSARLSERRINVAVRFTAVQNSDGKVLWSGTEAKSLTDTVFVDEIPVLRMSSEHVAGSVMPERSALERIVEPFIIVAAAGVAVYLFFTIRS